MNFTEIEIMGDAFATQNTEDFAKKEAYHQDYVELFTNNNAKDMLPYAYMEASSYYDSLLRNNPGYYPFRDESRIIQENSEIFSQYLAGITDIVEIGPGSDYALEHKTLPLLSYTNSLTHYHAVDISQNYLQDIAKFVQDHTNNLTITLTEANLLKDKLVLPRQENQKAIVCLGSTLGNFIPAEQKIWLEQLSQTANVNDILIFTIDTNHDEQSLLGAYENSNLWNLVMGVLRFFEKMSPSFSECIDKFKVQSTWNAILEAVQMDFIVTDNCSFSLEGHDMVEIKKGQKFETVKSRKFTEAKIRDLFSEVNFETLESLSYDNKIKVLIAKKI